jgi:hypothetical protein
MSPVGLLSDDVYRPPVTSSGSESQSPGDAWYFPLSTPSRRAVGKHVFARLKRRIYIQLGAHVITFAHNDHRLHPSDDLHYRPRNSFLRALADFASALSSPGVTAAAHCTPCQTRRLDR